MIVEKNLVDIVDLKIILYSGFGEYSITDLCKKVGIAYKNLLIHLNKLERRNWIKKIKVQNSRKLIIKSTRLGSQMFLLIVRTEKDFYQLGLVPKTVTVKERKNWLTMFHKLLAAKKVPSY